MGARCTRILILTALALILVPAEPGFALHGTAAASVRAPQKARRHASARKKARAASKKKARRRAARRRARRARSRRQQRKRKHGNMPAGWQWPPSPAMVERAARCREELSEEGLAFKKAGRIPKIAAPIRVPSMAFGAIRLVPTFRKGPFTLDCHLALALLAVAPILSEAGIKELRFSSIHSYRKAIVGGKQTKSLSRHALGLAVDVYEMRDSAGALHVVKDEYADSELLHRAETLLNESGRFRLVLTPQNDPASHSDHFHLEARVPALPAPAQAQSSKSKSKSSKSKARRGARSKRARR